MLGRRLTWPWIGLLFAFTAVSAIRHKQARHGALPLEPGLIAQSMAQGHGFSYPASAQWFYLRAEGDTTTFRPTAWQEPIWPAIMAVAYALIPDPERARDALIALRALLLLATAPALVTLGRTLFGTRVGVPAGVVAASILVLLPDVQETVFTSVKSQCLLGLEVVVACWLFVECHRQPTPARGARLGALLALTALTGSATVLFAPVVATALLRARRTSLALLGTWAAVIAPWSLRNYSVFHEVVPIRNGFGLILMSGNPLLAQTFLPGTGGCPGFDQPVFVARDAWEAVRLTQVRKDGNLLDYRPIECGERTLGGRYFEMNEAQRDRYWASAAWTFIGSTPRVALELAVPKVVEFFFRTGTFAAVITLGALVGLALCLRNGAALVVFLATTSQAVPYVLSIPYGYRYRYPLEPVLLLFAASAGVALASRVRQVGAGRPGVA